MRIHILFNTKYFNKNNAFSNLCMFQGRNMLHTKSKHYLISRNSEY